ncbi:hemerythrin domain-containing protein [Actinokineospora soli]
MGADVVDLIMQDHREVERLFAELKQSPEKRPLLVPVLSALLTAHSRAEEAEVYPVAKAEAGETEEVEHSQREHAQAEQLLAKLVGTDPETPEFDEVLTELEEAVTHHVEEEETTVLPRMREQLDEDRRAELGRAFATSRADALGDRPGQASAAELRTQARNAGLTGASGMTKKELAEQLMRS